MEEEQPVILTVDLPSQPLTILPYLPFPPSVYLITLLVPLLFPYSFPPPRKHSIFNFVSQNIQ